MFLALVSLTSVYSRTSPQRVQAAAPATLNFQARLLSGTGSLVPDGTYNIEFKLYNASTSTGSSQGSCTGDANCLWTETRTSGNKVEVKNGYLSAYLGDVSALPSNIWNQQLWLTMNIGGTGSPTWDGEMTPRIRLTSVPYAFRATVANSAETLSKNTGSFTGTVDFSTMTADRTFLFPDTSLATTGSPGTICVYNGTASNCPAASGSAYYIQNDTVVQTQTNFNIQARDSTTNGTVAGVFRGAAGGQTVDLVQFQATGGSVLAAVTATGNLQVAGSVDTRAAGTLSLGNSTATAVSIGSGGITTTVNGALTASGATTLSSTLAVTGTATLSSTLGVTGLSTLSGGLTVTNGGDVAFQRNTTDITATGTLTDVNIGTGALFRFNGALAQTLSSVANPADGRVITLINAAATALTIQNDTGGTAANRIITGTGGNVSVPTDGTVTLIYDSSASRWRLNGSSATAGGAANQQLSNLSGTVAVNQSLNPGTDNTLDLGSSANSWRSLYADTSVLTPSVDTVAAGTLSIGNTNATTINVGTNAAGHTINIGTSTTGNQNVSIGSSVNGGYLYLQSGTAGMAVISAGALHTDFDGQYTLGSSTNSNNFFTIDSTTGAANFTAYAQLSAYGSASFFDQGITLGSTNGLTYTTPGNYSLTTRINIPNYTVTGYNSIIAFGLPSASSSTARGLLVADARTVAHQATIGVLAPDESDIFGFSWNGSSTNASLATIGASSHILLSPGGTAVIDAYATGISLLQNTSVTGTLGVSGATTLSSTLGVTGAATLSSTLGVTGATTLSSTLGVTGATTLSSTLGVTGATTLSSTLGVTGLSTLSGGLTVTNGGDVAFQRNATDITATGTLTDLNIGTGALFRFNGATAQTLSSIANPTDGRVVTLINAAATPLTIQNDTGGTAANRIITGTGGDLSVPTGATVQLTYDSSATRWRVVGSAATSGGGANQQLSNLSGTVAVNQSLNPGNDNTLDLGSSANSWRTLYADTSVLTPTVDTATATTLNIGTTTANAVSISRTGVTTTVNGALTVTQATTLNAGVTATGGAVSLTGNAASSLTTSSGALTLTSAAAATWSTTAGNLTIQAGSGTVSFGTTTALTATGALGITSGGANALSLDAGGAAAINIGTGSANAVSISRTGITTTVNGALTVTEATTLSSTVGVTGLATLSGGLTVTSGGNVAFQRNTTDITATGTLTDLNIGTGALFRFNGALAQTLSSVANPADGRIITIVNAAATSLTIQNDTGGTAANRIITGTGGDVSILTGASMTLAYDSSASRWRVIGAVAGGGANQQLSNLSGTVAVNLALNPGTDNTLDLGSSANSWRTLYADTSVLTPTVDTATATTLNLGTVTANAVSISRTGVTTTVNGALTVTQAATFNGGVSVASNLTVTNAGNVAFQRGASDYSSTGPQDNISFGTGALFRITSASALTINGISGGADGRIITLVNASANTVTIANNASGTAANNVTTGTGTSIVIPAGASQTLAYDSSSTVWRVIGATAPTNGYVLLQSATPGSAQSGNINVSGTGIFGTALLSPSLDVASAGTLSLGVTTATSILMGNNNTTTITVGQSTATNTVNVGNGNLTSGTQTINLGTGVSGTGVSTISIGSVNAGSATTIRGGTGGVTLSTNGGASSTTGTIIQSATNNSTNALRVQNAAGANLLQIDTTNNNINLLGNNAGEPQPWSTGTPLSTGAQARDNTAGVYYNGYLYIPAGDNSSAVQTTVAYIKVKTDGSLDSTWATTGTSVPTRSYVTVAQANGYLYIMGGASNVASTNVNTEVYYAKINADGTVGTFAQTAPLPAARKSGAAVVLNGYMYYVGGDSSATGTPSATTTVYYAKINPDGTLGAWATTSNALPTAGYGKSGVAANGYIYYVRSGSPLIYYVKPSATTGNTTGAWSTESTNQIPGGPTYTSLYVNNGYLYEVAGEQTGSFTTSVYYSALNANGSLSAWSTAAAVNQLPSGRSGGSFMQANGFMYYVGGWNGTTAQSTAYYTSLPRVKIGGSLDLVGYSGEYLADGRTGGELTAGNTRIIGTLDVNDMANFLNTVSIQRDLSVNGWSAFKNTSNSTTAYQFQNASGTSILNIDTTNSRVGIGTTAPSYDLSFGGDAARSIRLEARTTNAAGSNLTIAAGGAGSGASPFTGGTLVLQGGAAGGTGNANGGGVTITGGAGTGTGVQGLVRLDPAAFYASSTVTLSATSNLNTLLTNATNIYSTVPVNATGTGYTLTVDLPTVTTVGRILYISAVSGSSDFTLALAGTSVNISMKANSTATLIYNGTGWTAAGASSSTDLQAAYNNTLSSAGGAEIVLNASGGAADGLTIRNNSTTPIIGGLLEVQTSIGSNLLSVNNFATEYAVNGGGETSTNFSTNWSGTPTSGTASRTTTAGQYTTGQAGVSVLTTAAANSGVRNVLSTSLTASTQYSVSFTAKLSASTMSTLEVVYSRDGTNTSTTTCTTAQSLNSTTWSKITCLFTTPSSGITASNAIFIRQTDGSIRTWYIDNLSVTLNTSTSTPANVQIGGGLYGGQPTLFTLDQFSAAPVANGNSTYYGSMYYDTTTGRIQCYEADGWGACGSAPDNIIVLTPEYTGAVLNGSGVGTMTADFCANQAGISFQVNSSFCSSGNSRQYYKWTSPQATQQTYSIYVSYKLPSTFKQFASDSTITLTALTDNTTNGVVTYEVFRSTGSAITRCWDNATQETQVTSTVNTWQTVGINGNETSCSFAGGDNVIFKINVKAQSNANVYVENLNFTYYNN